MSTAERELTSLLIHGWSIDRIIDWMVYGLFGLHLLFILFRYTTGAVQVWQLAASSVVLGTLLGCRLASRTFQNSEHIQAAYLSLIGLMFAILAVVYQSSSPGLGFGPNRPLEITVVFLFIVMFPLIVSDARQYTTVEWAAVGCFALLTAIYLAHTLAYHPSSPQSRWPIWAAVIMGCNLFVVPRVIPERVFLWILPRLAAITVVLGLATYVVGEYSLWIFEVRQYPVSPGVSGLETDMPSIQSIFPNPNSLGLFSFAGFVAAIIELHRYLVARRYLGVGVVTLLATICGFGLFFSNARAAMLAAAVATGIYLIYAIGGRLTVPVAVVSAIFGVFGLIGGMYINTIDISAMNRFELWTASLRAIRDGPLLFGHGNGPTSLILESYHENDLSSSPHNAYLRVILQTGFVGGLAYLGLVGGSILAGMINYREVNVGILAFATGWAVHQVFEPYIMFQWSIGAVLATLTIGYLLFEK